MRPNAYVCGRACLQQAGATLHKSPLNLGLFLFPLNPEKLSKEHLTTQLTGL